MFDGCFCIERDALGEVLVPADAIYGAPNTQRAVKNFPVSGIPRWSLSAHLWAGYQRIVLLENQERLLSHILPAFLNCWVAFATGESCIVLLSSVNQHFLPSDVIEEWSVYISSCRNADFLRKFSADSKSAPEILCVAWMAEATPDLMGISCGEFPWFCETRFH